MIALKCKMCGGDLHPQENAFACECEFCGTLQTIPSVNDERKLALFARAQRLLFACEFEKASGVYESIVSDFPTEAEAYWGLVLCKYGIEYVDDPETKKKIPTCHRTSFDSVFDDSNFEQATENADPVARRLYREEAKSIEELRKGIIEVSGKEEPYDVFICYKETDETGNRTLDSLIAQDIYNELIDNGYRVFFSRITLEDKLGKEYEPYIFAALNSARIMLAIGTDYEYYNAVWVKNEWSRFLKLISSGEKKFLIPCYKNIDAYDMPKEFSKLQAQDMGKVGAMQDLMRGIKKIYDPNKNTSKAKTTDPHIFFLLESARLSLEDNNWTKAKEYYDQVVEAEPKAAEAYLGLLMCELETNTWETFTEKFVETQNALLDNVNYLRARRFAIGELDTQFKKLDAFVQQQQEKREEEWKQEYSTILNQAEKIVSTDCIMVAEESTTINTQVESVAGIVLRQGFISPYMVTEDDTQEAVIDNPLILLCNEAIDGIQSILPLLEEVVQAGKSLLIICPDMEQECLNTLVINKQRGTFVSVVVRVASKGEKPKGILEDIAVCTGATAYHGNIGFSMKNITIDMLGSAKKVIVSKDYTIILSKQENEKNVKSRTDVLSKAINETNDELQKEKFIDRKNAISQSFALVRIGGDNENGIKEKARRINIEFAKRRRESLSSFIPEEQRTENWTRCEQQLIGEATALAGIEGAILVENSRRIDSFVTNVKGIKFNQGYLSPYMITDTDSQEAVLNNPYVLLSDQTISTIQEPLAILEQIVQLGYSLLIIAPKFSSEFLDTLATAIKNGQIKAVAVKAPGIDSQQIEYIKDLSVLTGASIVSSNGIVSWSSFNLEHLGRLKRVIIGKKTTILIQYNDDHTSQCSMQKINMRTEQIKEQIIQAKTEKEKNQLFERYSKLKNGITTVYVGGENDQEIEARIKRIKVTIEKTANQSENNYLVKLVEQRILDEKQWDEEIRVQEERKRKESEERIKAEQLRKEQELLRKKNTLENERRELQKELSNLKGLLSGIKRQRIERRMKEIEIELQNIQFTKG